MRNTTSCSPAVDATAPRNSPPPSQTNCAHAGFAGVEPALTHFMVLAIRESVAPLLARNGDTTMDAAHSTTDATATVAVALASNDMSITFLVVSFNVAFVPASCEELVILFAVVVVVVVVVDTAEYVKVFDGGVIVAIVSMLVIDNSVTSIASGGRPAAAMLTVVVSRAGWTALVSGSVAFFVDDVPSRDAHSQASTRPLRSIKAATRSGKFVALHTSTAWLLQSTELFASIVDPLPTTNAWLQVPGPPRMKPMGPTRANKRFDSTAPANTPDHWPSSALAPSTAARSPALTMIAPAATTTTTLVHTIFALLGFFVPASIVAKEPPRTPDTSACRHSSVESTSATATSVHGTAVVLPVETVGALSGDGYVCPCALLAPGSENPHVAAGG